MPTGVTDTAFWNSAREAQDKMFNKESKLGPRHSNGRYKEFYGDPLCNIMLSPEQAEFSFHYNSNSTESNLMFDAHAEAVKGSPRANDYDISNKYKFTYGYWNDNFDLKEMQEFSTRNLISPGKEYDQAEKEAIIEAANASFLRKKSEISINTNNDVLWACTTHQSASLHDPSTVLRYALQTVNQTGSNSFIYSLIKAVSNNNPLQHAAGSALTEITGKDSNLKDIAPCISLPNIYVTCAINYTIFGSVDMENVNNYQLCGNYGGTCQDLENFEEHYNKTYTSEEAGSCRAGTALTGCTDDEAINRTPYATTDDGSCKYKVLGCIDPKAKNPDTNANTDDESCEYLKGCTNPEAENFVGKEGKDPAEYRDDWPVGESLCKFPQGTILGCKNINAMNYYPQATVDTVPTSCRELPHKLGCMIQMYEEYDPNATADDASCKVLAVKPTSYLYIIIAIIISLIILLLGLYYYLK
jgi:hypothetical protein